MRKIILMPIILLSFVTYSAAQLKVMHSGRVSMENNLSVVPDTVSDTVPAIKIASTALFEKSAYGIYSKVWYQKNPAGPHFSFGNRAIAVYGSSEDNLIPLNHTSTPPFNAGVAGTSDKGVGVYGAIKDTFPIFNPGSYAGYFMGNTKVIGTLSYTSLTQTSDACTKHDITYLNDNTIGSIMQLKPLSFLLQYRRQALQCSRCGKPRSQTDALRLYRPRITRSTTRYCVYGTRQSAKYQLYRTYSVVGPNNSKSRRKNR